MRVVTFVKADIVNNAWDLGLSFSVINYSLSSVSPPQALVFMMSKVKWITVLALKMHKVILCA